MLSPVVVNSLIQTGVVIILCIGFTFTYMVEKFPNFAHIAIATFGTILSYSLVKIYNFDPYATIPLSMLLCGFIGFILYVIVVRPIKATGAREITLTFAFFVLAVMMASLVNMYSYWYLLSQGAPTAGFDLVSRDHNLGGYPGILVFILPTCGVLVTLLWFFLTKMKHGIAFRAVAEDEALASSLGVNVNTVHILTWVITGALAGLAGAIIPLWTYTGLGYNDTFLILVMAGSVIGGINSVAGAVVGGFLTAVSQKVLTALAIAIYGIDAAAWESLYPSILIVVILMLEPEGIVGIFNHPHNPIRALRENFDRLREYLRKTIHAT